MGLDKLENYMIGVILFIVVVSGGAYTLTIFFNSDNTLDTTGEIDQFNASLNKAEDISESVEGIEQSIQSVTEVDAGVLGWINALVGSAFSGLKALGHTLGFMEVAAGELAGILGVPTFIVPLLFLVVIVIIGFAIWSAVMRVS